VPARVDRTTGYRRYSEDQIATAGRIALLRRAGVGLADIERFLSVPTAAVIERWLADLAAETGARRRALDALAFALGLDTSRPDEPAMAVFICPVDSSAELVTVFDAAGAQFDPGGSIRPHQDASKWTHLTMTGRPEMVALRAASTRNGRSKPSQDPTTSESD
jgi:hypothetical protein